MSTIPTSNCPYKGLQPYTEEDRKYFFGRERDVEVVASNLYVTPLTVLYGGSGVGKSSVLQAGVIPKLKAKPRTVIVYFNEWQSDAFDGALKRQVLDAACRAKGVTPTETLEKVSAALEEAFEGDGRGGRRRPGAPAVEDFTLDDLLLGCARGLHLRILLIFDQFEEYFLYHTPGTSAEGFDAEFARAVNQHDDGVNFMLSMREEELSKLDRFRVRIPNLLTNLLRLENLDREAAAEAITRPLDVYNEEHPETCKSIEDKLVEAILQQVGPENLGDGAAGQQPTAERRHGAVRIETPFLQVVLTRLWEEERRLGSDTLRLDTLNDLGGAKNIARTHLDEVMSKLDERERDTAASVMRFLVTPAGAKIAQQPSALAAWAELDPDAVRNVLTHLSSRQEMCILRKVSVPGQEERYELFHDVLGPAILNWQSRYTAARRLARQRADAEEKIRKERKRANRLAVGMAALVLLLVGMGALTAYALKQKDEAERQQTEANKQKTEADKQKSNAEEQERIAKNALTEVAHERDRANEQKTEAENQKTEAEKQKKLAEGQKEEALHAQAREAEARRSADELKLEADRQAKRAEERAAAAELANKKVETEVFKGAALGDLIEGRVKEATEKFTQLDGRYEKLQDPAGRAYASVKLADIHKEEANVDYLLMQMLEDSVLSESPDEGDEAAMREYVKQYTRLLMMSALAQSRDEKEGFRDMAVNAGRSAEAYERALAFNEASRAPDRARLAGEILSKLGDVRFALSVVKALASSPDQTDKASEKAARDEAWKGAVEQLKTYESARAAYAEARMPLEEAEMFRKQAAIYLMKVKDSATPTDAEEPAEKYDEETEQRVVENYLKAAEAYGRAQQPLKAALMHKAVGGLHLTRKEGRPYKLEAAVEQYELARKIYKDSRDGLREADITETLAGLYKDSNRDRALNYYKQAHATYIRSRVGVPARPNTSPVYKENDALQEIAKMESDSEGGAAALRKYVERELPGVGADAVTLAWTSGKLGDFYRAKGETAESLWYYGREREAWQKAGRLLEEADILLKLGKFQEDAGAVPDALRSFGEARKVYAASDAVPADANNKSDSKDLADSLVQIAEVYAKHDLRAALETYGEAVAWQLAQPPRRSRVAHLIGRIGRTLLGMKSAEAEQGFVRLYQDVVERLGAMNDLSAQGSTLSALGDIYLSGAAQEGRAREAIKFYERARAAHLRAGALGNVVNVLKEIGEAKIKAGESEQEVVAYYEAAAAASGSANDLGGQGSAFEALGNFYRQKEVQKALDFYQKARRAYGEAKLTAAEIDLLRTMSAVYHSRGDKEMGEKLSKEASALFAKLR